MSLWPVEKVRVDKNLPYYLVQYAEPLHTPAAFLCQGWRSTGCPNLVLSIKRIATKMSIANSFLFAAAKNVYFERKWEKVYLYKLDILCPLLWLFITQYLSCFVRTTYEWLKPIYGISHLMPHATCCVVVIANDRTCCKVHFWVLFKSTIATFFVCGNFPLWEFSYSPTASVKAEFFKSERGHYSVVLTTYFHFSHFHRSIWFHYRYKL